MATTRTTFTMDDQLAKRARDLGINVSAAARDGVAEAVRTALGESDRAAYLRIPERPDPFWMDSQVWGEK